MSFSIATVTVTDTETAVFSSGTGSTAALVRNHGSATAYLGPVGVTSGTGLPLQSGELVAFSGLGAADVLKGICDTGESTTLKLIWRA